MENDQWWIRPHADGGLWCDLCGFYSPARSAKSIAQFRELHQHSERQEGSNTDHLTNPIVGEVGRALEPDFVTLAEP